MNRLKDRRYNYWGYFSLEKARVWGVYAKVYIGMSTAKMVLLSWGTEGFKHTPIAVQCCDAEIFYTARNLIRNFGCCLISCLLKMTSFLLTFALFPFHIFFQKKWQFICLVLWIYGGSVMAMDFFFINDIIQYHEVTEMRSETAWHDRHNLYLSEVLPLSEGWFNLMEDRRLNWWVGVFLLI